MHLKYFVGHKKPEFALWKDFIFFEIPNEYKAHELSGSLFSANYLNDKIFGEYSFLFAIRHSLKNQKYEADDLITICQYRRFVLNKKMGQQSINAPWCMVLTQNEIENTSIQNEILPINHSSYLIGSAIKIDSTMNFYAQFHFLRDILRFTSILIDLEILTDEDAFNFLNQEFLIPSPSCGTFTIRTFISILDKLEEAAKGFWNSGYRPYENEYQCRVVGFLLERLNSFLLISECLKHTKDMSNLIGFTTIISETLDISRGKVDA